MWIARDKSGYLFLCSEKPIRTENAWVSCCIGHTMLLEKSLFPNLKWEDEPEEVRLCLNNGKYHTVRLEELERLYSVDWIHKDICENLHDLEYRVDKFNSLPWYKRLFNHV